MSGITGYINNVKKAPNTLLDKMYESMRFIKSDRVDKWNDNFVAISRVHHGITNPESQPIFNEDESLFIIMDGEVFDYNEQKLRLIHNGHKFKYENNDAEYCLHLYEEMGEDAFKELNGSFCITIYNLGTHEFLLVNDRFSSYPIFYYLTDKSKLLFGTQLSCILQSSEVPRELNITSIFEFFTFQKVLGTKTFYKDIKTLPPATVLYYRDSNIYLDTYWKMKYKKENHSEKYYVDTLAKALKKSVERRVGGDQRLGILLSGGLDSRTVLAASDKKIVCFTVGDFKNREFKIAKRIAKAKGCKHIFLKRNLNHYANLVDTAVEIGDGMYMFAHAHNIGFFNEIRKECDILLHAFAFDTLFKGLHLPTVSNKTSMEFDTILRNENYYENKPEQLFVEPYLTNLKDSVMQSLNVLLDQAEEVCSECHCRKFDYFVFSSAYNIPEYLYVIHNQTYIDQRTVAFDNDLLDLYLEIPVKLRMKGKIFKKAMKKINFRIASITNANTGFSPFIPRFLKWGLNRIRRIAEKLKIFKSKKYLHPSHNDGSWPNYAELIRHNEKLKELIENTIEDPESLDPSLFNIQRIKEIFKIHLSGKENFTEFLFLLITFGRWHKKYGTGNLPK